MADKLIYREFRLHNASHWQIIIAFVKMTVVAVLAQGRRLRVIFTEDEKKRTLEQNKFYWGPVLGAIAAQAWPNGEQFGKDTWHEYFADRYLPKTEIVTPFGKIIARRKSTTELNVGEFSEYLDRVHAEAASEMGVVFDGEPV